MPSDQLSRRLRLVLALGLLVALNALFVGVLAWLYLVALPWLLVTPYLLVAEGTTVPVTELLRLPLSPPVLAGGIVAFLGAQVYYGYTRVLESVYDGTVDAETAPTLHEVVGRLAAAADVPKPDIAVVASEIPNSFTVGSGRSATIVVTDGLLSVLDDEELEAVLAHEIAHVKHRDVTLMTVTGLFVAIADRALGTAGLLRRGTGNLDRLSNPAQLVYQWLFPLVFFTYVVVAPILWLFPPVARFASGELSRQREYAADRAAADLTGAPLSLANALIAIHDVSPAVAETDLRTERGGLQALCVVPRGVLLEVERSGTHSDTGRTRGRRGADRTTQRASSDRDRRASPTSASGDATADGSHDPDPDPSRSSRTAGASTLEPESWLEEADTDDAQAARTHPPIERRVNRLVEYASES